MRISLYHSSPYKGHNSVCQVSLNWLVCQGNVIPIPGAKNRAQVRTTETSDRWLLIRLGVGVDGVWFEDDDVRLKCIHVSNKTA